MLPVSLQIRNFFSHKDSYIDFSKFDSALLVGNIEGDYDISNGSGKSAIFESILWCLFNKSRAASQDDVIFWGENSCKVTFTFKHSGEYYRVIRTRNRANSHASVTFFKQDSNDDWVDISGSTSSLTNDEIIKTINFDYKTFVNSAYFRQNDISEFAETDASRKKAILKSIIDISKWDEYEVKTKLEIKELRGEVKVLTARIEDYDVVTKDLGEAEFSLDLAKKELEQKTKEREILSSSVTTMERRYQEMKSTLDTSQWDVASEKIVKLTEQRNTVLSRLKNLSESFKEYKSIFSSKNSELDRLNKDIELLSFTPDIDHQIKEANEQLIELKAKSSSSESLIKEAEKIQIVSGQCYVCQQDIDDNLHDKLSKEHESKLGEYNRIRIYSQNKINELNDNLREMKLKKAVNQKIEALNNKISALRLEIKFVQDRLSEITKEKDNFILQGDKIEADIKINNNILDSLRNNDFRELQKDLSLKRVELKNLGSSIESLNRNLGILTEKASNLRSKLDEMKVVKLEYVEKQKRLAILDKMAKMLGKNGIQTILLNAVIEDLEKTSNEIMNSICNEDFTLFLETQRLHSDGVSVVDTLDLKVKKDGIVQNFKSLSGGEKFRISLALRVALSEISSRHGGSALEFLLLDEINSPLDRSGTESLFANVIKSLEKKYKILVITHNDSLKEKFKNIIDVTKINGESSVTYTID